MLSRWRRNRFSASSRRGDLKKSITNIASECRSANIVRDHALILPDGATPKPDGIFGIHTGPAPPGSDSRGKTRYLEIRGLPHRPAPRSNSLRRVGLGRVHNERESGGVVADGIG